MTRPAIVNSRATPRSAIFGSSAGSNGQVLSSGSNGETFWSTFVRTISADGSNYLMNPDVNLASGSNIVFTFDAPPIGGGSLPSNTVRIHSTGGGGGATLSYGSNATRVSEDSSAGVNASVSRSDHRHDGIGTITASSSNTLQRGTVNLRAGNNVSFGLTDADGDGEFDTMTIHASASGGGGSPGATGALVLLEQHTASSSAQLDFTSFISSTYDEYLFEFINVLPATNDAALRVRMGTGGGPTWDTGANYGWSIYIFRGGGNANNGADSGQTYIALTYDSGGTVNISNGTNDGGYHGHMRLFDPSSAVYKWTTGVGSYQDAEPHLMGITTAGKYLSTTAVTGVRFYMSSGNITSGTIRAYGIAKT